MAAGAGRAALVYAAIFVAGFLSTLAYLGVGSDTRNALSEPGTPQSRRAPAGPTLRAAGQTAPGRHPANEPYAQPAGTDAPALNPVTGDVEPVPDPEPALTVRLRHMPGHGQWEAAIMNGSDRELALTATITNDQSGKREVRTLTLPAGESHRVDPREGWNLEAGDEVTLTGDGVAETSARVP